jgi:hypothetical protein
MPLPTIFDLRKVPVGSWAEYDVSAGAAGSMKQRFALVARDAKHVTLEVSMQGGPMPAGNRMVLQIQTTPELDGKDDRVVLQVTGAPPMLMPQNMGGKPLRRLAPNELGAAETLKVAAGSFKTRKTEQTSEWGKFTAWVSEDVPPIGIVRLEGKPSGGAAPGGGDVTVELTSKGRGAKPTVKGEPQPFDPAKIMQAMQAAQSPPAPKPTK